MYLAQCLCGDIQFKSNTKPVIELSCHCNDCRNATGRDFSNLVFFTLADSHVKGETVAKNFIVESGNKTSRQACPTCGTIMFDRSEGFQSLIGVFATQLEKPFIFKPQCHVWVSSKLPSSHIDKSIMQYPQGIS